MSNPPWTPHDNQINSRRRSAQRQKDYLAKGIDKIRAERIQAVKDAHESKVVPIDLGRRFR